MLQAVNEDLDFDRAPGELVAKIKKNLASVRKIEILNRRGQRGYIKTGRHLDIITPEEVANAEGDPELQVAEELESPEEIALTVWEQARGWVDVHGPGMFKFVLRDESGTKITDVVATISAEGDQTLPAAANGNSPERESEIVDMTRLAAQIARDCHTRYMDIAKHNLNLHGKNLDFHSSAANAEVERVRIQGSLLNRKFDMAETRINAEASARKWEAAVSPFTMVGEKIGEVVGDRLKFWLMWLEEFAQQNGVEPPPKSFSAALRQILEGKDLATVQAECDRVDAELWTLFERLLQAPDNGTFKNIAREFKSRAFQAHLRKREPAKIFDAVTALLTEAEAKRLMVLFKHTGVI